MSIFQYPNDGESTIKSRGGIFGFVELGVVTAIYAVLQYANYNGYIPDSLSLSFLQIAWVYTTYTFLVFVWLKISGETLSLYGLKAPPSIGRLVLFTFLGMLGVIVANIFILSLINQLFNLQPTDLSRFDSLRGDFGNFMLLVGGSWLFGALGEELLFRGFVMTRIARLLGDGRGAWAAALILQAIIFGVSHSYQGASGIVATGLSGFIYGLIYWLAGKNLWAAGLTHGLMNTLGAYLIYSSAP